MGERTFLSISFRHLSPRPEQGLWQKTISSWSSFRAEQEPLKTKQNHPVTACQAHILGTSSPVNLQSMPEPRGLMLSRSWGLLSKAF